MKTIVLLLALVLMTPCLAPAQVNGVTVEVTLDQQEFLPDEDAVVTVHVLNRSGQPLELGRDWVSFSVQGENNMVVEKKGEFSAVGGFALKPAQAESRDFNLTPYFAFRQPGRYTVVAAIKVPQWDQNIVSKPILFTVMRGVPVANLPDLEFGVPLPAGGAGVPEVRRYVLEKAIYVKAIKLYFRLTDPAGNKTFRVYPIGPMVSFGQPEAQIDARSNLHVLYQFYAKSFCYCVIDPDGKLQIRQIYDYAQSRPALRTDSEGRVYVGGGIRKYTPSDLPPPQTAPSFPVNTNATNR